MSPSVCFVVRSFAPRNESGSLRCTAFARYLPDLGFDVSVFCAAPNQENSAGTAAHVTQNWQDDPAWKRVTRVEWNGQSTTWNALRRLPIGSTLSNRRGFRQQLRDLYPPLKAHIEECRPDVLFASCAPPETLVLARQASAEFGIPFITDLRDPWSTVSASPHRHIIDYWLGRRLETKIHRQAAHVVVASNRSAELLVREHGLDPNHITFIPNGFVEEELTEFQVPQSIPTDRFVIVHSGELNPGVNRKRYASLKALLGLDYDPLRADESSRSPIPILQALQQLFSESPEIRGKLVVAFTGLRLDRLPRVITQFPYQDNLRLFGRIASNEAHGVMLRGDLLLLMATNYSYRNQEFCCTIPAKTYSYIRTGNPILASTISSELKELLSSYQQVRFVNPADVGGMAAAIRQSLASWTPRREKCHLKTCPPDTTRFSREHGTKKLAELLHRVLERSKRQIR